MSGLKNVTREQTAKFGHVIWRLLDDSNLPIQAFSYYCEKNQNLAFSTQKRYAEVVAHFIDYLIEAEVFGHPVTKQRLNVVLDAYPMLLRDGSLALRTRILNAIDDCPDDLWLADVAAALKKKPLKHGSFQNTIAAINRFLRLSESLAIEAFEKASLLGIVHQDSYRDLINALRGRRNLTHVEIRNMRHNSVIGSVMRFRSHG